MFATSRGADVGGGRISTPRDLDHCKSLVLEQSCDVVVELRWQCTGIQLIEVDQLNEIHELGRPAVQRVVDQPLDLYLTTTTTPREKFQKKVSTVDNHCTHLTASFPGQPG